MSAFKKPSFFRSNEELLDQFEMVNEPPPVPSDFENDSDDGEASASESSQSTLVFANVRDPKGVEIEALRAANKSLREENAALRPLHEENRALRAIISQLRADIEAAKKNEAKNREGKKGSVKKAIKAGKEMQELSIKMA